MKWNSKKLLTAIALGLGIFAVSAVCTPTMTYAYYADTSSVVYQGMDRQGMKNGAINVVDDDGTVYTFYYKYKPSTDYAMYRVAGESTWRGFLNFGKGPHAPAPPHIQNLALVGLKALSNAVGY